MLQEEIARLTGKLVFQVDNRPLATFEKKLNGVLGMLRELSTLANKKFTVKVALDSRSLRAQIEKATKTKISLTNVDVSNEALHTQGKRIQEYLNRTTINLNNVKIDISKLVEQKRFVKTLLGQMAIDIPAKLGISKLESQLRSELKGMSDRNPLKVKVELNNNNLAIKLRRALIEAQKRMGQMKLRVADPQVRLKVDRQHLIDEIRAAIASSEFKIRIGASRGGLDRGRDRSGPAGRGQMERGLSAFGNFARGALPGLGAAFAFSQMNDINQAVTAAQNSLEAVSGSQANFKSNLNFVNNIAKEMGLNFRDVAPQFSSIFQAAAPNIGVGGTQDMFRGIMKYGTVHGLDKEAMKGSMRALSQMFGKDKIQSEEARQQFAERMPNGMALLAQAAKNAGLTSKGTVAEFEDLMRKGKADPTKVLPELAKLMEQLANKNDAYRKSLETTRVAQGRMNNAFEESVVVFSKGGFDKGMASFFNTLTDSMERAKPLTEALGAAFAILVKPVNALIRLVGFLGENWGKIADALGVSKEALATLATAIGIFMLPFGAFITALGAAALALDDLFTYMAGGDSVFGDFVKETPGAQEAVDNIAKSFQGIVDILGKLMTALGPVGESFKGLTINDVFLKALQTIDTQLQNIYKTMQLIQALMNGDLGAADEAAQGINLLGGKTTYNRIRESLTGENQDEKGPSFWSYESWLGTAGTGVNGRMPRDRGMPLPPVSLADPRQQPSVQTGPMSFVLNVQAPEGVTDPTAFGNKLGAHIQTLLDESLRNILGAARAQQAER